MPLSHKWYESFIWIPAIICFIFRILDTTTNLKWMNPWFYIVPGLITILTFLLYFKSQLHFDVLKDVFLTFRSLVSCISLIIVIICDCIRNQRHYHDEPIRWIILSMDEMIYCALITYFICIDACKNVSNFTRAVGPALLIAVSVQNLLFCYKKWGTWKDYVLFNHRGVDISLKEIESAAILQIILFCVGLVFTVFNDWEHKKFFHLKKKIPRKASIMRKATKHNMARAHLSHQMLEVSLLSSYHLEEDVDEQKEQSISQYTISQRQDMNLYLKNTCCYLLLIIIGIIEMIFYLADINWIIVVSALCLVFLLAMLYLLKKNLHFQVAFGDILTQFRVWILSMSVLVILFCAAYDIHLDNRDNELLESDWCGLIESIMYCLAIILAILRDGMVYPLSFSISLPVIVLIPTYYSIYESLFLWTDDKPYWYLYMLRTAYIQVALLNQLILWSVYRDPGHCYFTLIFEKKLREDSFHTNSSSKKDINIIKPTINTKNSFSSMNNAMIPMTQTIRPISPMTPPFQPAFNNNNSSQTGMAILFSDRELTPPPEIPKSLSNDADDFVLIQ